MKTVIIGEKLNSSNSRIRDILEKRDRGQLLEIARAQIAGGASYIDINASMLIKDERDALLWAAGEISERLDAAVSLDSPDAGLLAGAAPHFGDKCLLNSLTSDRDVLEKAAPVLSDSNASVIVMLKDRRSIPESSTGRVSLASSAVRILTASGVREERIFLDPVFSPAATDSRGLNTALETLESLKEEFPLCRRVGGLSNISFGLPMRKLLNRTFLVMAISRGIDTLICDPTDRRLISAIYAAEAVTGIDEGCRGFLGYYRDSKKGKS